MFKLLPKTQLQCFVFFCHGGMLIQIISEVQFIVVSGISQMDMVHLVCKSISWLPPL